MWWTWFVKREVDLHRLGDGYELASRDSGVPARP